MLREGHTLVMLCPQLRFCLAESDGWHRRHSAAFEATCSLVSGRTVLQIRQSGFEHSDRWTRYYDVISTGLTVALEELKRHVESQWND